MIFQGHSGVPEAPSGYPSSPPGSPRRSSIARGSRGASRAIAKECERLLCGDMTRIFLGGRSEPKIVSRLGMASIGSSYLSTLSSSTSSDATSSSSQQSFEHHYLRSNHQSLQQLQFQHQQQQQHGGGYFRDEEVGAGGGGMVDRYIEVWDYVGNSSFRGFIAERQLPRENVERTLFLFFEDIAGTQLKTGSASDTIPNTHPSWPMKLTSTSLMALIELASECFACDRLVICLERNGDGLQNLIRDLGWVGFELITLQHWARSSVGDRHSLRSASFSSTSTSSSSILTTEDQDFTSGKWLFMGMEV